MTTTNTATATKTGPATTPATAKPPRKPRAPSMTVKQKFDLQRFVIDAPKTDSDGSVAKAASAALSMTVRTATVSEYRRAFGLASVARPSYAQLEAHIEVLKAAIVARGDVPPAMP